MKRYEVEISFVNGDRVQARTEARNKNDAIRRIKATKQFIEFQAQAGDIVTEYVEEIPIETIDNSRFVVTNVANKEGWYVVADLENRIKVEFKKGHYNDMQKVSYFGKGEIDALQSATALREIGEYMYEFFKELI